ncbi:MAG: FAD-dependent oxidoreductase [Hymenobacter sp.]
MIGKLVAQLAGRPLEQLLARPSVTTLAYLRRFGWSEQIIDSFFRPFFGGVYLDRELDTASNFFEFVFQQFVQGAAAMPALGIQELPNQLASRLPAGTVRLNAPVAAVAEGGRVVHLASGETLAAAAVVLATDGPAAARLLGAGLPAPHSPRRPAYYLHVFCHRRPSPQPRPPPAAPQRPARRAGPQRRLPDRGVPGAGPGRSGPGVGEHAGRARLIGGRADDTAAYRAGGLVWAGGPPVAAPGALTASSRRCPCTAPASPCSRNYS